MQYKTVIVLSFLCFFLNTSATQEENGDRLEIVLPIKVYRETQYWAGKDKLRVSDFYSKHDDNASLRSTHAQGFGVWGADGSLVGNIPASCAKLAFDTSVSIREDYRPGFSGAREGSMGFDEMDATDFKYKVCPVKLFLETGWRTHMPAGGRYVVFEVESVLYHQSKVQNESWHTGFVIFDAETGKIVNRLKLGLSYGGKNALEKVVQSWVGAAVRE